MQVKRLLGTCQVNVDADLINTSGKAFITLHPPTQTAPVAAPTAPLVNGKRPLSRKYGYFYFFIR